jgi:predicted AlkP superfamily pyrophosphatase or phosphodiesterase
MTKILLIITILALLRPDDFKPTDLSQLMAIAQTISRSTEPDYQMLANGGVRAKWMTPAYPSLTFPTTTRLSRFEPQSNGIISNTIYDREARRTFAMGKREEVTDSRWWLGEPIWVTAEKQGQKTAPMSAGSEAEIWVRPSYWRFDDNLPNDERLTVLKWPICQ